MADFLNPDGTPAVLTPEEQAQADAIYAEKSKPAETVIDPYKPLIFDDENGQPAKLTPQEHAAARKAAGLVDPLLDLSPDDMVAYARQTEGLPPGQQFSILGAFVARQDEVSRDPEAVNKVSEAWRKYKESTGWGDLPSVGEAVKTAGHVAYGLADYIGTVFKNLPKRALTEAGSPANLEATRNLAEAAAATETSLTGLAQMGERLFRTAPQPEDLSKLAQKLPVVGKYIPEAKSVRRESDPVENLFADVARANQIKDVVEKGGVLGSEKAVQSLKEAGYPLRPEEVEKMAAGDPVGFYLFGKAFGAISKALPGVPESALATAGRGVATAAGVTVEGLAKGAAKVAPTVAKYAPPAMAVKGAFVGGGAGSPIAGAIVGHQVGKGFAKSVTKAIPKLESIASAGRQIAGKEAVKSGWVQLAKDVAQATPAAGYEAGKGLAFDVALGGLAETPEEAKGVGLGLVFGLAGAAGRMGGHVLSGQLIAPREWGTARVIPSNKYFPGLDTLHTQAYTAAPAGVRTRVNAVRAFVKEALPNADFIYAGPKPEAGPDPLVARLTELGITPEQAEVWANQAGLTSQRVNGKQLIIARDVEAAPHESFHALEDVLGESTMRKIDALIQGDPKYQGQTWEAIARNYAERLGWTPESGQSWQDAILDTSKWGVSNAAEKLARGDKVGPISEQEMLASLEQARDNWRNILSPEEQAEVANRYVSRELAAENFDAVFKHGAGTGDLPGKIAKYVGHFVRHLGGDPLAGRAAEFSGYPLSFDVAKLQKKILATKKAPTEVQQPRPTSIRRGGMPTTPEQQQEAATEARELAAGASGVPRAGGFKSVRELLGTLAESIASRTGVKLNYRSAPTEPAASLSANRVARRAMIEEGRTMPPEAKSVWEKTFFPERVIRLQDGSFQVLGWAPEVLAANGHRAARAIAEMVAKDPRLDGVLSPYPIDPATKTFTPEGWKQLFTDIQQDVQNLVSGRTGSGLPLVVPKDVAARGLFAPSLQKGAGPLEQFRADFINLLFGFKIPETPRITGGKLPLNVAAQEISAATLPGRVVEPVRPRGKFTGEKAVEQGIEGREILEVNPLRNALERAAQQTGVKMPSFIEAVQRLNMKDVLEVDHAPEAPEFRGNTLTLTAGFQPPRQSGFTSSDQRELTRLFSKGALSSPEQQSLKRLQDKLSYYSAEFKQQVKARLTQDLQKVEAPGPLAALLTEVSRRQTKLGEAVTYHTKDGQYEIEHLPLSDGYTVTKITDNVTEADTLGTVHGQGRLLDFLTGRSKELPQETWEPGSPERQGTERSAEYISKHFDEIFPPDSGGAEGPPDWWKTGEAPPPFEPPSFPTQFQGVNKPATEVPDFRPEEIRGAEVNLPRTAYHEAAQQEGNPWVRRSADPARSTAVENADRNLLVQISSDLINPESLAGAAKDQATQYYDMLYSGARPGYARLQDFWEIPQWIGFASKFLPDADVYVVRDVAQAREFLKQAGYGRVAFSALDTNKALIRELIKDYEGKVDIGGYTDPKTFSDLPNVKWHDSMESMAKDAGVPYVEGVDYRHFQGSDVIPRLTMSKGCRHKCAFCSVPKIVEESPAEVVRQQADAIAELGSKLVYLNDKTFGQAGNYKQLAEINKQILAKNPDFKGFIIQTTAAQLKVMPTDWLKQSGIKFVELGIESYNDPILKAMHKPATESLINQVTGKLREAGIALIPNIIIGFPEETAATYAKTLDWLKANKDIISHANIYNLALYKDAELGKKVITASEGDFNENVLEKSFHTNPEIHRQFAGDVYGLAQQMLEGKPSAAQFQAKTQTGKALEEQGFTFDDAAPKGKVIVRILKGPDVVGHISATSVDANTSRVSYVAVEPEYRAQGMAETLYRELATRLQDRGIANLQGDVVHPAPLKIREKLFGEAEQTGPEVGTAWGGTSKPVTSEIRPDVQFQPPKEVRPIDEIPDTKEKLFPGIQFSPSKDPRAIKTAAVRDPETGKIFEGPAHFYAMTAAMDAGIQGTKLVGLDQGFVTNSGEFLLRTAAFERAKELQQLPEKTLAKEAQAAEGVKPGLMSEDLAAKLPETTKEVVSFNDHIKETSPEEWSDWAHSVAGGLTGVAHKIGLKARTPQDLAILRSTAEQYESLTKSALANDKVDLAIILSSKSQAAREAYESATGKTLTGEKDILTTLKRLHGADYEPPMAQFEPLAREAQDLRRRGDREFSLEGAAVEGDIRRRVEAVGAAGDVMREALVTDQAPRKGETRRFSVTLPGIGSAEGFVKGTHAELLGIEVDQSKLRRGYGTQLLTRFAEEAKTSGATEIGGAIISPEAKALFDKVLGKPAREKQIEDWEPVGDFQPVEADYPLAQYEPLSIKRKPDEFTFSKGWLSPEGKWYRLEPTEAHEAWARKATGLYPTPGGDRTASLASDELYRRGWLRVTPYGSESLMSNTTGGRKPSEAQEQALLAGAAETGVDKVYHDNGHSYGLLEAQFAGKRSPQKDEDNLRVLSSSSIHWLDPQGKLQSAQPNHEETARRILNLPTLASTGLKETAEAAEASEGRRGLFERGWQRIVRDSNGDPPTIHVEGDKNPSKAQREALQALGEARNHTVFVDQLGAPIFEVQAQFAGKRSPQEEKNNRAYKRDSVGTHGWWLNPAGDLLRLSTGEHATDALKILGIQVAKKDRYDAYSEAAIGAYNTLVSKGWRAVLPQTYYKGGEPVSTLLFRGSGEGEVKINRSQRAALERLAIEHELAILNNLGDPVYTPPTVPKTMEPPMMGSVQFAPFQSKNFDKELEKIRSGKSGGQTFTPEGEIWKTPEEPTDLVSLASVNVPLGKLTREAVETALAPYLDILDEPGITAGMFAFSKDGKPTVSIDINAIVPQEHRANTLDFAKQNDQVSIWDATKSEEVKSGGKGNTKLKTLDEVIDALGDLQVGKPVDVEEIIRQNRPPEAQAEQQQLFGGREYASTAGMTKAEIAQKFPEAIVPRRRTEPISSDILNSPLAKAATGEAERVASFARKLVEFAKEYQDHPAFDSGTKWYSEFVPMLKKKFGKDAPIMAELLAGTSPQQPPTQNYAMALDALQGFKSGRFDKNIAQFEKGLEKLKDGSWEKWLRKEGGPLPATPTEATFINAWVKKYNLLPRQSNGKLYSISSDAVLKILARRWLGNTPGLKTQNFVKNLLGVEHEATIDLWADRTMRRVGYSGSKERWRILPKNATGVSDADFVFAQKAFRAAAEEMGMLPDALQGGLWFAEKQLWADQGWGRLDLGDFRKEIVKTKLLESGIQQRLAKQKAVAKQKPVEQLGLDIVEPR